MSGGVRQRVRHDGGMAAPAETQTVSVDGRQIKLTNLEKVLYPATGTTKADVLFYYAQVGRVMLPHLRQRPVTRKRWPDGVGTEQKRGPAFFNKDLDNGTPDWVHSYRIAHKDHDNDYPVIDDLATLTWLAQLASLELHVPQWRFDLHGVPRNPDRLLPDPHPREGGAPAGCGGGGPRGRAIPAAHRPHPLPAAH